MQPPACSAHWAPIAWEAPSQDFAQLAFSVTLEQSLQYQIPNVPQDITAVSEQQL